MLNGSKTKPGTIMWLNCSKSGAGETEEEIDLLIYLPVEYPELLARYLHYFNEASVPLVENSVEQ